MEGGLGFLFIRGALFNGKFNARVQESFDETYSELLSRKDKDRYDNNMIDFMLKVMDMAKEELKNNNLLLAGYDINLLHNLPETISNRWDEDYFYKGELLGYLEHMSEANRVDKIKKMIQLTAKHLLK